MSGRKDAVRLYNSIGARECAEVIMSAASKRRAVVLLGVCEVSYRGRTSSELGSGERLVILKEDGSLLVHRSWGYKPVNYMPPGGIVYAKSEGDSVVINAKRGLESIRVVFHVVYVAAVLNFTDESTFEQRGTEAQMREAVILSPELVEKGLRVLTHEFQVKSGFVDLISLDSKGRLVAIEFKANPAKTADVNQLIAYVSRLRALSRDRAIRGILAAPGINKAARKLLVEGGLEFKRLDKQECLRVLEEFKPTISLLNFLGEGDESKA
ncbi:MAG: endonuclease NucS [Thermoprotei archaeon]